MLRNSIGADDDMQLAVAVKQGHQPSLGLIYDKYAPALSGIISRIANEEILIEKILTVAFVKVWNQIAAYNPSNSSFFSWLIMIARETAFEEVKSEQLKNPTASNTVYKAHQQSAFELVYYKGLSYSEAATTLQLTVAEVKANIKMALENRKENTVV